MDHGLKSNIPYVLDLLDSQDILFINEHWLQEKDIITIVDICAGKNTHLKYKNTHLKSSVDPMSPMLERPYGGIGFLCTKTKGIIYRILPCETDRIMVLQVIINQKVVLCLVGVYLPHDNSTLIQTKAYIETLDYLQSIIDSLAGVPIVILGDTSTVLPESFYLKDKWYTQKRYNKRSLLLYEFMSQNNLCTANFMFEQKVKY